MLATRTTGVPDVCCPMKNSGREIYASGGDSFVAPLNTPRLFCCLVQERCFFLWHCAADYHHTTLWCGRLSWLPVSFLLHVKYSLSYRIVLQWWYASRGISLIFERRVDIGDVLEFLSFIRAAADSLVGKDLQPSGTTLPYSDILEFLSLWSRFSVAKRPHDALRP